MDLHLNPALERLYIDEVRRLHSLWRRGPPRHPNGPNPNPSPSPTPTPGLGPSSSTAFKREDRKKQRKAEKKRRKAEKQQQLLLQSSSDPQDQAQPYDRPNSTPPAIEWPCESPLEPRPEAAGWGDPRPKATFAAHTRPLSEEENVRIAAMLVQQNGIKICQNFFAKNDFSDNEGEDDEGDDPMDGAEEVNAGGEDGDESGDFRFFLDLFEKDTDLRGYYEKNWEKGEFCCLVCGGIGVKMWKRFGDCIGLVQHSSSISKTKRQKAHRALGRAICRVLGWDIKRLPSIVLEMGKPLGQTLVKAAGPQLEGAPNQNVELPKEVHGSVRMENEGLMDGVEIIDISDRPTPAAYCHKMHEDLQYESAPNQEEEIRKEAQETGQK